MVLQARHRWKEDLVAFRRYKSRISKDWINPNRLQDDQNTSETQNLAMIKDKYHRVNSKTTTTIKSKVLTKTIKTIKAPSGYIKNRQKETHV